MLLLAGPRLHGQAPAQAVAQAPAAVPAQAVIQGQAVAQAAAVGLRSGDTVDVRERAAGGRGAVGRAVHSG